MQASKHLSPHKTTEPEVQEAQGFAVYPENLVLCSQWEQKMEPELELEQKLEPEQEQVLELEQGLEQELELELEREPIAAR